MPRRELHTPSPVDTPGAVHADGTRTFTHVHYGVDKTLRIEPQNFQDQVLAGQLADAFLEVAEEATGSAVEISVAIRSFLDFLTQFPREAGTTVTLGTLTRRQVDAWEMALLERQRADRTDTTYRRIVYFLSLLRRIEDDNPGTLRPDLAARIESRTRLSHIRRPGSEAFSPGAIRAMRGEAHRQVYRAQARHSAGNPFRLQRLEAVAIHVLLSIATGEPAEVLRRLTAQDLIVTAPAHAHATTASLGHREALQQLISRPDVESLEVTYFKARSGQRYQYVYTPQRHPAIFRAYRALLVLGATARAEMDRDELWVAYGHDGAPSIVDWSDSRIHLHKWIEGSGIADRVEEPHHYRRIRTQATTREALKDPTKYLRDGRHHTPQTFFQHYTNSPILRASAGRLLVDTIASRFENALRGPTIITPDAEELMREGVTTEEIGGDEFTSLDKGTLDTPMAGCRDPYASPFTQADHLCAVATTGDCFACPNALILRRHLPAAVRLAQLTNPDRAADIDIWRTRWASIHETITEVVLPAFDPADVQAAEALSGEVLLDPTLLNDLGSVQ